MQSPTYLPSEPVSWLGEIKPRTCVFVLFAKRAAGSLLLASFFQHIAVPSIALDGIGAISDWICERPQTNLNSIYVDIINK